MSADPKDSASSHSIAADGDQHASATEPAEDETSQQKQPSDSHGDIGRDESAAQDPRLTDGNRGIADTSPESAAAPVQQANDGQNEITAQRGEEEGSSDGSFRLEETVTDKKVKPEAADDVVDSRVQQSDTTPTKRLDGTQYDSDFSSFRSSAAKARQEDPYADDAFDSDS